MIGFDLLNDLFKNNIDYTAKSLQILVDHLFPSNDDNSETPVNASDYPLIINGQCIIDNGRVWNGGAYQSIQSYYNFYYNSLSDNNAFNWVSWYNNPSDSAIADYNAHTSVNSVYLNPYTLGHDSLLQYSGNTWYVNNHVNYGGVFTNYYGGETVAYNYAYENKSMIVYFGLDRFTEFGTNKADIYLLGSSDTRKIILTDNINTANTVYNNYINYNNDYHTSNTYNFNGGSSNGGGDVFVGGGAGGFVICPVGAVGYADIEFALDSLIDDLNLNFNNTTNKYPVDTFPSYDEIKYEDMGSFYITPIKQIDTLPLAPDIADTVIDVSDYVDLLGGATTALFSALDGLGLSLIATFTFLSVLVIRHLKR